MMRKRKKKYKVAYKSPYTNALEWVKSQGKIATFKTPKIAVSKANKKIKRFKKIFLIEEIR